MSEQEFLSFLSALDIFWFSVSVFKMPINVVWHLLAECLSTQVLLNGCWVDIFMGWN